MATDSTRDADALHVNDIPSRDSDDRFDDLEKDQKKGLFGKINARFQDKLQDGRGEEAIQNIREEPTKEKPVSADVVSGPFGPVSITIHTMWTQTRVSLY